MKTQHTTTCETCGLDFEMNDLSQVIAHEHSNQMSIHTTHESKKVMTTYTAQLEQIKSNALRDIEAYMKLKLSINIPTIGLIDRDSNKNLVFLSNYSCTHIPLSHIEVSKVSSIADYINSINDK